MCQSKVNCDFLDLVCFAKPENNFFQNLKYIVEKSGIDYYKNFDEGIPESLKILKQE